MKIGKVALVVLSVAALAQAAFLTYKHFNQPDEDGEDAPAHFVCGNPVCGVEFLQTREQLIASTKASPDGVPCPSCQKTTTTRSVRCPSCQKPLALEGHGRVPSRCTGCKKAIAVDENNVPFCPGG